MQVQPADRAKAIVLVVAIVGIMGFVLKTALIRPKPEETPPPVAVNTPPAPAPTGANPPGPEPAVPGKQPPSPNPETIAPGTGNLGGATSGAVAQRTGVNPFRATVPNKDDVPGSTGAPAGKPGGRTGGSAQLGGGTNPWPVPDSFKQEADFRLAGVLIDSPSVAIVTRGGTQTQFLRVGSNAAYGYKVAEIRPRGIRVSQKNSSKWVMVGERLQPPVMAAPMIPGAAPSGTSGNSMVPNGGSMIGAGITPGWDVARLPNVQISSGGAQVQDGRNDGWHSDITAAKLIAKREGKMIFVDFMATWCGPCKKLDAEVLSTPRFNKYSGKLVLLRIDVDAQPNVAQAYRVNAMPTQMVLRPDGSVIRSTVGYSNPDRFFQFLDNALSS